MGIDPGLATTGYGVLENGACRDYGMVSTSAGTPIPQRIEAIVNRFDTLFRRFRPDACAIETLFFKAVGARSVILTAQLRGALFYMLARRRIPVTELTPATIKLILTGNGRAAKRQMQYMVRALLRVRDPIPDHAADALAAAYCLSKRMRETQYRAAPLQYRRSAPCRKRGVGRSDTASEAILQAKRSDKRSDTAIAVTRRTGSRR